ncbi:MAG: 7-carboxy-7-deazaguanine synthase QueE [Gammaproteobacteria bacterium]
MSDERLRITEIFYSLQGEAATVGWPTTFIRLTGCPLRCGYCDTTYAFQGGAWWTLDAIINEAKKYQTPYITVTGGEPLAQKNCLLLLARLCDAGYQVSLETSGALDIAAVDPRVTIVMDLKTPSSGEVEKNRWANLPLLKHSDQVKLVMADRTDYDWAVDVLRQYQLEQKCTVLFSPVQGQLEPRQLSDWILQDQLPVRFQIQLHKVLWDNAPGR